MIFLIAPNTPDSRRELIYRYSSGYLYCVSRLGITGMQADLTGGLAEYLDSIRSQTDLPLAVGFGISKPEHAAAVCRHADGAIVGSAIVNRITEYKEQPEKMLEEISAYTGAMKRAAGGTL
jgi:tryptophan synthase alpha chain